MEKFPPIDLLESTHSFPGVYQIKAIGSVDDGFENRVISAARSETANDSDVEFTVRTTPGGRHISITLEIKAESAEQVRRIYAKIHQEKGIAYLL